MKKNLLLLPVLLFGLTACVPQEDDAEKFEEGATEISMWMMDFEEWENQINIDQRIAFNRDLTDGIQVKQTYIDSNSFDDLIRSAYESHNVPDIYMVSYGNVYKEKKAGRARDLTDYFSQDIWNDLTDNAKEGVCLGGHYYAFPINMEPSTLLAYRKSQMEKYIGTNYTVPTTWQGLLDTCATAKAAIKQERRKNFTTFQLPMGVALAWASWGTQYAATGGLAVTDNWDESRITNPGYRSLCNLWNDIYSNGYVPLAAGNYTEASFDLCDDKCMMTTCGSWSVGSIANNYPELIDDIGFAVMPTFDGNQDTVTATNGGWTYVISSECRDVEKAVQVIKKLTAEDTANPVEYFEKAHYSKASPRKSVKALLNTSYQNQTTIPTEWIDVVNYVADRAILEPIYEWDISVAVEGMLEESAMAEDSTGIDAAITKANNRVNQIITSSATAGQNPRYTGE